MSEKNIEMKLVEGVKKIKGSIYKFNSQANNGVPDRICVLPTGIVVFIELKKPGGKLSEIQKYQIERLQKLRQKVIVISSLDDVDRFLKLYDYVRDYV